MNINLLIAVLVLAVVATVVMAPPPPDGVKPPKKLGGGLMKGKGKDGRKPPAERGHPRCGKNGWRLVRRMKMCYKVHNCAQEDCGTMDDVRTKCKQPSTIAEYHESNNATKDFRHHLLQDLRSKHTAIENSPMKARILAALKAKGITSIADLFSRMPAIAFKDGCHDPAIVNGTVQIIDVVCDDVTIGAYVCQKQPDPPMTEKLVP